MDDSKLDAFKGLFEADTLAERNTWKQKTLPASFTKERSAWNSARKNFIELLDKGGDIDGLKTDYLTAHEELSKLGTKDKLGNFVKDSGELESEFEEAVEKLGEAKEKLFAYLRGESKVNENTIGKSSKDLATAFTKAEEKGSNLTRIMNGFFSKLKLQGFEAAANDNLAFWDEAVTKNRSGAVFGKVTMTGAGLAVVGDSIIRDKNADGEARSVLSRVAMGGVGLAVAGVAAVSGAAR